jgi:hypothetical protein
MVDRAAQAADHIRVGFLLEADMGIADLHEVSPFFGAAMTVPSFVAPSVRGTPTATVYTAAAPDHEARLRGERSCGRA